MKITTIKGKVHHLKGINDKEYDKACQLAGKIPLDECITCGGKKEEIPNSGGVMEFRSKTYKNKKGETVECDCHSQMALRTRYLLANIGDLYQTLDWDDFTDGQVKATIDEYIDNWENFSHHGFGLELGGKDMGVGKTFAATHIGKELIKRGQSVYFIPFNDLVFAYELEDEKLDDKFRSVTYLIIDEVKLPRTTAQAEVFADRFEAMIRHRTNYNLPTIITTNVSETKLDGAYPRVYSLLAAKQDRVEFKGEDVRYKQREKNASLALNEVRNPIT